LIRHFDAAVPPAIRQNLFEDFDVYFQQRRLSRTVYLIYDHLYQRPGSLASDLQATYKTVWQALNRQMRVYESLQTAMENLVDEPPLDWKARNPMVIWQDVQSALHCLLDETSTAAQLLPPAYTPDQTAPGTWLHQGQLTAFHQALSAEITEHIRDHG